MSNELLLSELLSNSKNYLGHRVIVNAVLVLCGGECYLVPNADSHDAIQRIEIYAPGLEKILDVSVGGWGGLQATLIK